jgi:ABC-type sugar transport system permease subunit
MTGGGPGTATEPISLYAFSVLFRELRIGYGSALSMLVFAVSFVLALVWIQLLGAARAGDVGS